VRVDPGVQRRDVPTRVTSLLDEIRPLAKDGTGGRESRLSLRGDIARIKDGPGKQQRRPRAVAIFACGARGLYAEVPLPRPAPDLVLVGATPLAPAHAGRTRGRLPLLRNAG
jgi:peptide chain release factor subunit 1